MVILKATSLFDGHFMDIYMTCRITQVGLVIKCIREDLWGANLY